MSRIPDRCTCTEDLAYEGECDFCVGNYPCPGGCGKLASDCACDEKSNDE